MRNLQEQEIQKWLKTKICSFYGEFENEKKKGRKIFEPQFFSNFPAHDLNLHVK